MSGFRQPERPRDSHVLFPTRLDDAIPPADRVRKFAEILATDVFQQTFRALERDYHLLDGKPPYHPKCLASLYLYGMMDGIRSSRKLEAACKNRIDVIWLMEGQCPDHSTIAGFVKRHALVRWR